MACRNSAAELAITGSPPCRRITSAMWVEKSRSVTMATIGGWAGSADNAGARVGVDEVSFIKGSVHQWLLRYKSSHPQSRRFG